MSRDDIIRMAREAASKFAGWDDWDSNKPASGPNGNEPHEEREYWISVVEFIAAAEREVCAKVCDLMEQQAEGTECCKWPTPIDCAAAIRARSTP